jgi:hypothetical protein
MKGNEKYIERRISIMNIRVNNDKRSCIIDALYSVY